MQPKVPLGCKFECFQEVKQKLGGGDGGCGEGGGERGSRQEDARHLLVFGCSSRSTARYALADRGKDHGTHTRIKQTEVLLRDVQCSVL